MRHDVTRIRPENISQRHEEFAQLFGQCSDWLYGYLLALLRNPTDAEDALQETGRLCWEKLDQYHPGTQFRAWACRIAYFEAMKIRDRRKQQNTSCSDQFFEVVSSEAVVMADQLQAQGAALAKCLERLPAKDRDLIDKRYTFDIPAKELAKGLGRSVHAIYRALRRIHDMLQRCINRSIAEQ